MLILVRQVWFSVRHFGMTRDNQTGSAWQVLIEIQKFGGVFLLGLLLRVTTEKRARLNYVENLELIPDEIPLNSRTSVSNKRLGGSYELLWPTSFLLYKSNFILFRFNVFCFFFL